MPTCPQCGRGLVRPARRQGRLDVLLRLVVIHPFRCQLCSHRFYAVLRRQSGNPRRDYERVHVNYPVFFAPAHSNSPFTGVSGTLLDLTIRGCSIESPVPVLHGSSLRLQIQASESAPPIEIESAVVRAVTGSKKRLAFLKIRPEEEDRIRQLMASRLHNRLP